MKSTAKLRLRIYITVFTILMLVGIVGFMFFEKMSLTNAIYFSIVTMATVGYGDISPHTMIGKLLALIIIIGGVGTFLGVVASITDLFVNRREEAIRQQKVDMITGLFFSEMGTGLLRRFVRLDSGVEQLNARLKISEEWQKGDYDKAGQFFARHRFAIHSHPGDMPAFMDYLQSKADLLLRLIENPNIQEHEQFTELLRALFHLRDELLNRRDLDSLTDPDRNHLEGDMARVYKLLLFEWLRYIRYLQKSYGYLFSLAVRTNPFDPDASAVVQNQ